jgi:hypothetical protein
MVQRGFPNMDFLPKESSSLCRVQLLANPLPGMDSARAKLTYKKSWEDMH